MKLRRLIESLLATAAAAAAGGPVGSSSEGLGCGHGNDNPNDCLTEIFLPASTLGAKNPHASSMAALMHDGTVAKAAADCLCPGITQDFSIYSL